MQLGCCHPNKGPDALQPEPPRKRLHSLGQVRGQSRVYDHGGEGVLNVASFVPFTSPKTCEESCPEEVSVEMAKES